MKIMFNFRETAKENIALWQKSPWTYFVKNFVGSLPFGILFGLLMRDLSLGIFFTAGFPFFSFIIDNAIMLSQRKR